MRIQVPQVSAAGELVDCQSSHVSDVSRTSILRLILIQLAMVSAFVGMSIFLAASASAAASPPAPSFRITTVAFPSIVHPVIGQVGQYEIVVENVGGATSSGEAVLKDTLPAGLTVDNVGGATCPTIGGSEVSCSLAANVVPSGFAVISIIYTVTGNLGAGPLVNRASLSGGGAAPVSDETSRSVGPEHEIGPPGIEHFGFEATDSAGEPMTQAGAHPNFLTTSLVLNTVYAKNSNEPLKPVAPVKDLVFYLPVGMLGNPTVASLCPSSLVEISPSLTGCPSSSRVGTILPMILSAVDANAPDPTNEYGLYNVQPEKGYAAEFAFASLGYTFEIYASLVRHDGQYMVRIATPGVPGIAQLTGLIATFYGDIQERYVSGFEEVVLDRGSFLTDPSDCEESGQAREGSVALNTWVDPDPSLPIGASAQALPAVEGCEQLKFATKLNVVPESSQADEPSGYEVGLEVPQAPNDASGLGTPPLKDVEVELPEGTTISPASANGLVGCAETGSSGINIEGAESEGVGADGLSRPVAGHCPGASQIGTVTAVTPLLREGLSGHLYIATPNCGGVGQHECTDADAADGELFGVYLEMEAPNAGVIIKLKGTAQVDPVTGRITTVFKDNPQFPLSKLTVALKTGPRAPLANAQTCGVATSQGTFTPWSAPGTPSSSSTSTFNSTWDGTSTACPPSPFAPSFTAGTTTPTAGAFSSFSLVLKREDREQDVASLSSTLPQGLLAAVANVGRCPEPQASQASLSACPASSQIGTTTVSVGSGSEPYYVTGKVFFTGPYGGAPFGLSVVVPAAAGPFNLGNVLVRVALFVDPHTAQVTAVSGPLPQKLDGVPLRIRTLNVSLDAHEFVLNPTNCSQLSITGVIHSTTGTNVSVGSPFAASGCKKLAFKPSLSASTKGKTSKAGGASLTIRVGSGTGQANISKVRLVFPKQLPARLTTLQKACTESQFNANPAGCPAGSVIGTATAHTAILKSALTGPIYLVSHGGAAFPDAVVVLQGEGVLLYLDGNTNIKKGITTSTFNSIPDAPISTFEATLPQGAHSAFATDIPTKAKGNLCGQSLTLPATITGQNGAQVSQNTKIGISGCPKAKKKAKPKKGKRKKSRKK